MNVGDVVCKKSGKPFKSGLKTGRIVEVLSENPQDPKRRPAVRMEDGSVVSQYQIAG